VSKLILLLWLAGSLVAYEAVPVSAACPPIKRSQAVVRQFRKIHPCPATGRTTGACKNWVIDHRYPLCAGGKDAVANLAWQELQASRDKDRLEREVCRLRPRSCPHQGD
jgi:hypothetical protein